MYKNRSLLAGLVVSSAILVSANAVAQDGYMPGPMMYGQPQGMNAPMQEPQGGHYPAPPMNPQMMQQMMANQKQRMQEMQARQKADAAAQKPARLAESKQQVQDGNPVNCKHHGKKAGMHGMMQHKQAHMARLEKSLANIEKLMQEMITLMKSK